MPAENTLRAKITADISDLRSKLEKANKITEKYGKKIDRVKGIISQANNASKRYSRRISRLNDAYRKGSISSSKYNRELEELQSSYNKNQQEIRDSQRELGRLQQQYKKTKRAAERYVSQNKDTAVSQDRLADHTRQTSQAMDMFSHKSTANATSAVQSFSQVVQDAPYGIRGVANNIQQLTAQFGYLKERTGSSSAALKSFVASMTGPGGVLLAVSLITSLLVAYGDQIGNFIKDIDDARAAQIKFSKAISDSIGNAKTKITQIRILVGLIQDQNVSIAAQYEAYQQLKEVAPDITDEYDQQAIAAGEAKQAIDELSGSLIKQAKISGVKDLISKQYKKIVEERAALGKGTANFWDILVAGADEFNRQLVRVLTLGGKISREMPGYSESLKNLGTERGIENIKEYRKALNKYKDAYRSLANETDKTKIGPTKEIQNIPIPFTSDKAKEAAIRAGKKAAKEAAESLVKSAKKLTSKGIELPPIELNTKAKLIASLDADDTFKKSKDVFRKLSDNFDNFFKDNPVKLSFTADVNTKEGKRIVNKLQAVLGERFTGDGFDLHGLKLLQNELLKTTNIFRQLARQGLDVKGKLNDIFSDGIISAEELQGIEKFAEKMKSARAVADIFANATGAAFQRMGQNLISELDLANNALGAFAETLLSTITNMVAQLAANFIQRQIMQLFFGQTTIQIQKAVAQANALQAATSAAAALGPAGFFALPAFLGAAIAQVQGAFSAIHLAQGGIVPGGSFVGDRVPAMLNSGEMVLNTTQQSRLFDMLDGRLRNINAGENKITVNVTGQLRGDTIQLALDRYNRQRGRTS